MSKWLTFIAIFCFLNYGSSQDKSRLIEFPDVKGYKTLITDLHIHSIFSDGYVWPTIRVEEALKDGLDAISLTEHIEYQPWKEHMKHPDRNKSYEIAKQAAKVHELIVIHGAEITRNLPPGHANALFITDANALLVEDSFEAYRIARDQGAFIFWNHPHWNRQQKDGIPVLSGLHKKLIESDLLHGIEVVNDLTYSEEALQIANENNLTVMGTSDIHGLVDYQYRIDEGGHRPVTLVFAEEKTEESIKEALFAGRTITWFDEILSGNIENMTLLMNACVGFVVNGFEGDTDLLNVELTNSSDAVLYLNNDSVYDFYAQTDMITLKPHSKLKLQILTRRAHDYKHVPIQFKVLNAKVGYKSNYLLSFTLSNK